MLQGAQTIFCACSGTEQIHEENLLTDQLSKSYNGYRLLCRRKTASAHYVEVKRDEIKVSQSNGL